MHKFARGMPLTARFWAKYVPDPSSGCWLWTHSTFKTGYGKFRIGRSGTHYAHRLAYELHHGVAPGKAFVCHRCDNRLCINPEHLFLGDALTNNRDMAAKGRTQSGADHWMRRRPDASAILSAGCKRFYAEHPERRPIGSRHHLAKLTENDVHVIRTLHAWGMPHSMIARVFPVGRSGIGDITRRRIWRHI